MYLETLWVGNSVLLLFCEHFKTSNFQNENRYKDRYFLIPFQRMGIKVPTDMVIGRQRVKYGVG